MKTVFVFSSFLVASCLAQGYYDPNTGVYHPNVPVAAAAPTFYDYGATGAGIINTGAFAAAPATGAYVAAPGTGAFGTSPLINAFAAAPVAAAPFAVAPVATAALPAAALATGVSGRAWTPAPRDGSAWSNLHNTFMKKSQTDTPHIKAVFIGDSIIRDFQDEGINTWKSVYESKGAVNYGIGGDRTQNILYRIDDGELDGLSPNVVVLMIGTNNLSDGDSPDDIALGVRSIVQRLQQKLPRTTKIIVLGVLPRGDQKMLAKVRDVNARLASLNDGDQVFFQDMYNEFVTPQGDLKAELYKKDRVHLETGGYKTWAVTMYKLFRRFNGP